MAVEIVTWDGYISNPMGLYDATRLAENGETDCIRHVDENGHLVRRDFYNDGVFHHTEYHNRHRNCAVCGATGHHRWEADNQRYRCNTCRNG